MQKVWLDGAKVLDRRDVLYRTDPTALVEVFTFRNFHGGKSDKYRPLHDQFIWCATFLCCLLLERLRTDESKHIEPR